jgi:tRNA/rRNA methyltransferase/tRNA (cytidine32/uridine32-2'-O)-methyltransferase
MKNMGLSCLRLVLPREAPHAGDTQVPPLAALDAQTLLTRAVHAADVWEAARTSPTLREAVADCPLVIGTTRRRGRRKQATMTPRETAAFLAARPGPAALVFGNERTGLDTNELALCHLSSHIPSSAAFPSLNLSHAVQIYAYELYLALGPAAGTALPKGQWIPLPPERQDALVSEITQSLAALGFYRKPGREAQERFLRSLFARAGITASEGAYLKALVDRAAYLAVRAKLVPYL